MSEELERLRLERDGINEEIRKAKARLSEVEDRILAIEAESSPWRVGQILERTKVIRRNTGWHSYQKESRIERAVVVDIVRQWGKLSPKLVQVLKNGEMGKREIRVWYHSDWTDTGETMQVEEGR